MKKTVVTGMTADISANLKCGSTGQGYNVIKAFFSQVKIKKESGDSDVQNDVVFPSVKAELECNDGKKPVQRIKCAGGDFRKKGKSEIALKSIKWKVQVQY